MIRKHLFTIFFLLIICNTCAFAQNTKYQSKSQKRAYKSAIKSVETINNNKKASFLVTGKVKIDTIIIKESEINLHLKKSAAELPIRNEFIIALKSDFMANAHRTLKKKQLNIFIDGKKIEYYVPNIYRKSELKIDSTRMPNSSGLRPVRKNLVKPVKPYQITNGLSNSNIAMWGSHGWFYESSLDRWQWQRARLFTTVEDLGPSSFVLPYIIPMLNNAGAYVITPRERDIQTNEIIIDNDAENEFVKYPAYLQKSGLNAGYGYSKIIEENENPFKNGTYLFGTANEPDSIKWTPEFPENGEYMVYIAYGKVNNASEVKCRVYYGGGFQDYIIDQKLGAGTWIPLGKHFFAKGKNPYSGSVILYLNKGQTVSIDAIRFGGGMGNVLRNGKISGKPRFMEGTRYYLHYCGFPDTLIWRQSGNNKDYTDNYRCMGDWVNYLIGKPFGPPKDTLSGMGIPIDCSLAFHTDAGILGGDSTIGTLGIYSTAKDQGLFADGQSRYASRDFTDIIQSQIVDDIRIKYKSDWTRRGMWNSEYSEAYKANTPSMLLELLSHQNATEMKYALDPNFKFDVSRAIYKGILKFIAFQYNYPYVIQPLPVNNFQIEIINNNQAKLSWKAVADSLEPTAIPEKYIVYTRIGNSGFDQGKVVESNELIISNIDKNKIYSFKVTALNKGGESFPSEILSVGITNNSAKPILVVNGFDRLEAPEYVEGKEFAGFLRQQDQGVPYLYDFNTTGDQHDFDPKSEWKDDDSPGFGASYADEEGLIYPGNTFDFTYVHGKAILANGYSFTSSSDEAFIKNQNIQNKYCMIDFIMGEEKTRSVIKNSGSDNYKIFTPDFLNSLNRLNENKIPVFISGSYIGTEIGKDTVMAKKVGNLLGYKFRTGHAVKNGKVYFTGSKNQEMSGLNFITKYDKQIYPAEATDAIEAFDEKSNVILRYSENNMSAGVFANRENKTLSIGFPFECIDNDRDRENLMSFIIKKLLK